MQPPSWAISYGISSLWLSALGAGQDQPSVWLIPLTLFFCSVPFLCPHHKSYVRVSNGIGRQLQRASSHPLVAPHTCCPLPGTRTSHLPARHPEPSHPQAHTPHVATQLLRFALKSRWKRGFLQNVPPTTALRFAFRALFVLVGG